MMHPSRLPTWRLSVLLAAFILASLHCAGSLVAQAAPDAPRAAGAQDGASTNGAAAAAPAQEVQDPAAEESQNILWIVFVAIVSIVVAVDLFVFNRSAHTMKLKEALTWVAVWVTLALLFNVGILIGLGPKDAADFLAGYLVELNLSVDNLFVFLVIFSYFNVPPEYQHRVLTWGICGAVVFRLIFIFIGIAAVENFGWLLYVFGAILLLSGIKLLRGESDYDVENSWITRLARRILPLTKEFHGAKFFVKLTPPALASPSQTLAESNPSASSLETAPSGTQASVATHVKQRFYATPLFLVLVVIEATDLIFAVDSVPAIIGITKHPFVAFTSNVFAILGLRSMYFVLVAFVDKFHFLKYGLSLVLIFIGAKMLLEKWLHLSSLVSLIVVILILGSAVALSLLFPARSKILPPEESGPSDDE